MACRSKQLISGDTETWLIGWICVMCFISNEQHLRPEENEPKSHCTWTELLGVYVGALIWDLQVLVVCSGFSLWVLCSIPGGDDIPAQPQGFPFKMCSVCRGGVRTAFLVPTPALRQRPAGLRLPQPLICFLWWHPGFSRNPAGHSSPHGFCSFTARWQ